MQDRARLAGVIDILGQGRIGERHLQVPVMSKGLFSALLLAESNAPSRPATAPRGAGTIVEAERPAGPY
ncbi:hypothetical protein GQ57_07680 [Burkholderia sp. MSh2]|nr:hypothetical protein GQ57_07680 [Burkholderia sp. MSh2]